AAAHSKPLSAWTFVRLLEGSAMTAMTSGVSRSLISPLGPPGRKIGSQQAESSFDSFASCCHPCLTDELFTHMKRPGWRRAGVAEIGELEVVSAQLCRGDPAVGHERDDLLHGVAVRPHAIKIDLLEHDLLEVDRGRLLGDPGEGDPSALADHADRLPHGVLR